MISGEIIIHYFRLWLVLEGLDLQALTVVRVELGN